MVRIWYQFISIQAQVQLLYCHSGAGPGGAGQAARGGAAAEYLAHPPPLAWCVVIFALRLSSLISSCASISVLLYRLRSARTASYSACVKWRPGSRHLEQWHGSAGALAVQALLAPQASTRPPSCRIGPPAPALPAAA
jgi:hypothetical protein